MSSGVPRIGRVLDAVGLVFFLGGCALFVRSWVGFRSVPSFARAPDDVLTAAVDYADGFWRLQRVGVALMLVGIAVFVLAWFVARRRSES